MESVGAVAIPSRNSAAIAILVAGAFFMENLDGTVIATALPQMGRSFHVNPVDLNIGMTAYLLMLAVFIPISGWVADRFGARTVFVSAIAVFTASSILCGLSTGFWQFTAARVIQGIGGAMMVPVGRLVVLRTTEKHDLMRAMVYITWPGLVAPVVGPPVGGFITTYASWHWIFFLNVPLGVIAMALAAMWITNLREDQAKPFDWIGFALSATACVSFMYGLELIGRQNTPWRTTGLFLGCGAALGTLAVVHLRRAPAPVIDLSSLKIKTFAVTLGGGSLFRMAISVSPFLLPMMFQVGFGLDAFRSGLLMLALFAGNLGMKTVTSPVLRRFGFRSVLIANGILTAARNSCLFRARATNAEDCDYCGAVCEWPVPLDAVYQLEHAGLCGRSEIAVGLGHELLQHGYADDHGNGSRAWRNRATIGRPTGRPSRRHSRRDGVPYCFRHGFRIGVFGGN